ncbi:MAG TPA: pitrilysin family protein [Gemmatimonadaceae bacterium]|nr:pitrilysin family protein [Gemmatimonadaceae bacterium]
MDVAGAVTRGKAENARASVNKAAALETEPGLRRTVLPNGLTVLSEHMPGVRSVAIGAWVRAASLNETPDRMGVSHLLEHMVFKGTERRTAKEIALSLESLGGSLDAYTSREHTVYQARVLDEHLRIAADVLGDLVFEPVLRQADLDLERNVILEEIGMVEDTPDDLVFELQNTAMWGNHPLGYSILGTRETVSALGVKELRALHRGAYQPSNLIVAAAGNVDHDELLDILNETGWTGRPNGAVDVRAVPAATAAAPERKHIARDGSQTHIVIGSPTIGYRDPRRHAMVLLSVVLGGGMSSRLFQRVREELGLAYAVYTFQTFYAGCGVHGVYVGTAPRTADAALRAIEEELTHVVEHGLSDEEISQGKGQLKGQITLSLESPTARMYRAASVDLYGEPYRTLDEMLALVEGIAPDSVREVAREFFAPQRQTVVSLGPEERAPRKRARKRG